MVESALEEIEQNEVHYIHPDDIINILMIEDEEERLSFICGIIDGTKTGRVALHPELAILTFHVMCSDPKVAEIVFEDKGINWEIVGDAYLQQKQMLLGEIHKAKRSLERKRVSGKEPTAYELQLEVAEPYVQKAFTS